MGQVEQNDTWFLLLVGGVGYGSARDKREGRGIGRANTKEAKERECGVCECGVCGDVCVLGKGEKRRSFKKLQHQGVRNKSSVVSVGQTSCVCA